MALIVTGFINGEGLVLNGGLTFNGMPVGGIICDLEGTLVDLESFHHTAHALSADAVGVKIDLEDYRDMVTRFPHIVGGPDFEVAKEIWEQGNKKLSVAQILELKTRLFQEVLHGGEITIKARPGVHEFFQPIREVGIPLAIGSITNNIDAMFIMEQAGILDYFDIRVLGGDLTHPKPHPQVFLEGATRLGVHQKQLLIIEDSRTGVRAAYAAHEDPRYPMILALPARHDIGVAEDLRSLGAHMVAESWEGLLRVGHITKEGAQLFGRGEEDTTLQYQPGRRRLEQ